MSANIISQNGADLIVQVEINLSGSMLAIEENIVQACNEVGSLSTMEALSCFDTDGTPIVMGNNKYTSKTKSKKIYQTPYGAINVERHVYQDSSGGKIYVPMEHKARIIRGATPRFAKMLSQKYANMSAQETLDDLIVSNGRRTSKKYLQKVSEEVSNVIKAKADKWKYELPELDSSITSATISMDGAMLPMRNGAWRESMVGTISLYNKDGDRRYTIYAAESPEYGKASFIGHMEKEIMKVKEAFPSLLYLGIADGAKDNWTFLEKHTSRRLLDFYHVTEYLAEASYAAYSEKTGKPNRTKWLKDRCHQLKHCREAPKDILDELKRFSRKKKLTQVIQENLDAAITYFTNNIHRMNYAEHVENNLPIGSGVTEAACKTLVKQRFCRSGMRWKDAGIKVVLRLREFLQTAGRWQQFWQKVDQRGVSCVA